MRLFRTAPNNPHPPRGVQLHDVQRYPYAADRGLVLEGGGLARSPEGQAVLASWVGIKPRHPLVAGHALGPHLPRFPGVVLPQVREEATVHSPILSEFTRNSWAITRVVTLYIKEPENATTICLGMN
jgi:hypothetical protein